MIIKIKTLLVSTYRQISYLRQLSRIFSLAVVTLLSLGLVNVIFPSTVAACTNSQTCSTLYQVNEVEFGSGGAYGYGAGSSSTCSTNYCADEALGETGVGNTAGTTYQAQAGFNTFRSESLTFIVNGSSANLGVLTPGTTTTYNTTFSVETYLTDGYTVTTDTNSPSMGTHNLANITTAAASNSSAEQFGMNLVANTTGCGAPANFGANPVQTPSSAFSFGQAASGYNTCGLFQYNNGDTIAQSTKSSGETDYTISYIFNVTKVTPGGTYTFNQVLIATSTF